MKYVEMMQATPDELNRYFTVTRGLSYNNARMAQHTSPNSYANRKLANQQGFLLRQIDMLISVARKRGFRLEIVTD